MKPNLKKITEPLVIVGLVKTAIAALLITICVSISVGYGLKKGIIISLLYAVQWMAIHFVVSGTIVLLIYKTFVNTFDSDIDFEGIYYLSRRDWLVKSCAILSILIMTNAGAIGYYSRESISDKLMGLIIDDVIVTSASAILTALYIHFMLMLIHADARKLLLKNLDVIIISAAFLHISTGFVTFVGKLNGPLKQLSLILLAPQSYLVFVSVFRFAFWRINDSNKHIYCEELSAFADAKIKVAEIKEEILKKESEIQTLKAQLYVKQNLKWDQPKNSRKKQ